MVLSLAIPAGQQLHTADGPAIVISPDGSRIAYVTETSGGNYQIYVRDLDQSKATMLEGSLGFTPFFSPDGKWLGFFSADGKLGKVSVYGGAPIALASTAGARGASWSEDGTIIFTPSIVSGLDRISAAGGEPVAVTHLDKTKGQVTHRWPQILPGGKSVLFTASSDNNDFTHADVEAASLATGRAKVLVQNAYFGRYLRSGYLAYISGGTLFAAPFDAGRLKLTGPSVPVVQDIQSDLSNGSAQLSFSHGGTAVYLTGESVSSLVTVVLVDRKGNATTLVSQPGNYFAPKFSPHGKRLALQIGVGNIAVYDMARKTLAPLTFSNPQCIDPVWTPDGKRITCARPSSAGIGSGISWVPSNGTGSLVTLTKDVTYRQQVPFSWSPDGRALAFVDLSAPLGCCNIGILTLGLDGKLGKPKIFLRTRTEPTGVVGPAFSPDGRWLAYSQLTSGERQVFVVPYPGPGGKWQVSASEGQWPEWSKAGHELFFLGARSVGSLYAAHYSVQGNSFQPGAPQLLFKSNFELRNPFPSYDVAPDGKHFAMLQAVGGQSAAASPPTVVLNWFSRVERRIAAGRK